ncbi:hypothetical protein J1N35_001537 [Gossypium stocksii]|uniref:RNase H type-1 domain-containing protein n=1 Tax=Gossypium stocksii TaxID=47602 RepID=A0A9D4AMB7_9ROSI|nr:hypothetical protein J1N35_001537 [Gossypium stocksii]
MNQLMHEKVNTTARDLSQKIQYHVPKFEGTREIKASSNREINQKAEEVLPLVKIQFDAAFDNREFRSALGLVVWGTTNEYLASKSVLHTNVASPFAAEAHARLEAVKLGIKIGIQEIQILGDSQTVIKKCQAKATNFSVIGRLSKTFKANNLISER